MNRGAFRDFDEQMYDDRNRSDRNRRDNDRRDNDRRDNDRRDNDRRDNDRYKRTFDYRDDDRSKRFRDENYRRRNSRERDFRESDRGEMRNGDVRSKWRDLGPPGDSGSMHSSREGSRRSSRDSRTRDAAASQRLTEAEIKVIEMEIKSKQSDAPQNKWRDLEDPNILKNSKWNSGADSSKPDVIKDNAMDTAEIPGKKERAAVVLTPDASDILKNALLKALNDYEETTNRKLSAVYKDVESYRKVLWKPLAGGNFHCYLCKMAISEQDMSSHMVTHPRCYPPDRITNRFFSQQAGSDYTCIACDETVSAPEQDYKRLHIINKHQDQLSKCIDMVSADGAPQDAVDQDTQVINLLRDIDFGVLTQEHWIHLEIFKRVSTPDRIYNNEVILETDKFINQGFLHQLSLDNTNLSLFSGLEQMGISVRLAVITRIMADQLIELNEPIDRVREFIKRKLKSVNLNEYLETVSPPPAVVDDVRVVAAPVMYSNRDVSAGGFTLPLYKEETLRNPVWEQYANFSEDKLSFMRKLAKPNWKRCTICDMEVKMQQVKRHLSDMHPTVYPKISTMSSYFKGVKMGSYDFIQCLLCNEALKVGVEDNLRFDIQREHLVIHHQDKL